MAKKKETIEDNNRLLLNYVFENYYENSEQDTLGIFCYSLLNINKKSLLVNIAPCSFDTLDFNFVYNNLLGVIKFDDEYKIIVFSSFQVVKKKEDINESLIRKFETYFNELK